MPIHRYTNIWFIRHWERISKLPNTTSSQSWKDWLKYAKTAKYRSCRVAAATQELEMDGDG